MTRPVSSPTSCPLELARRLFARWRLERIAPDEPVPEPLVQIARALLGCFDARRISTALDVPVALVADAAFVALPAADPVPVADDEAHDVADLDALVIERPDGTRIELRGRVPAALLPELVHGPRAEPAR